VNPEFSPNGRFVFAYGGARWVKGFEVGSFKPYASYHAPPGVSLERASADLSHVVVTKEEPKRALVVEVGNNAETALERSFDASSYALSQDGAFVAAVNGPAVRVWSSKTGRVVYEVGG
jgi:hypothetical protein